jgi:exopolyphosphatase/guanosine-5'-triphosphate,3'-diphosphate pyrophosphatase
VSAEVVPRWEWRTFDDLRNAERYFAELRPERVEESDETYLLSRLSDASVKVRGGVLDVKRLERVNADRLERWRPVLKAPFGRRARRRRPVAGRGVLAGAAS